MEPNTPRSSGYRTGWTQYGSLARRLFRQLRPAELLGPLFFYDLVRLAGGDGVFCSVVSMR